LTKSTATIRNVFMRNRTTFKREKKKTFDQERTRMDRFEYLTKSAEEVEASLILVKSSLWTFVAEDTTRLGWRSDSDMILC
jgi:hypothetical protein